MLLDDLDKFTDYARTGNRHFRDLFNSSMERQDLDCSSESYEEKKFWNDSLVEASAFAMEHRDSLRFQGINAFSMHWNSTLADDQFFISLKRELTSIKFIDPSLEKNQILWSSSSAKKYLHRHSEEYALKVLKHFQTIKQISAERDLLIGLSEVEPVLFIYHSLSWGWDTHFDIDNTVICKLVMGAVVTRFNQDQPEDEEYFSYDIRTNSWSHYEEEDPF